MQISLDEVARVLRAQPSVRMQSRVSSGSYHAGAVVNTPASTVEVSDQAQEVRRVTKLVNQLPDVREDRIQALKAQIEAGTYNVSGEQIADLMIRRTLADGIQ